MKHANANRYLCQNWQGMLQLLVYLLSRGYYFIHVGYFPVRKKNKWEKIDEKLILRYQTTKSKFQRCRQKRLGVANFFYFRWEGVAIIAHTDGATENVSMEDTFIDIRYSPINISISELVSFKVSLVTPGISTTSKVEVALARETYKGLKEVLSVVASTKKTHLAIAEFSKINNFPAYSRVIKQKVLLAKYLIRQLRKNQIELSITELPIQTRLKRYKVFFDTDGNCEAE